MLCVAPLLGTDYETNMFHGSEFMHNNRGTVGDSVFCVVCTKGYITRTPAELVSYESVCENKTGRLVLHGRQPGS
jgi:hypothetical protein